MNTNQYSGLSLFPPSIPLQLPEFSTLIVSGLHHPSAPIHLALSLREHQNRRSVIFIPDFKPFKDSLHQFKDSWLLSQSGQGKMSGMAVEIDVVSAPSPSHLSMLLVTALSTTTTAEQALESSIIEDRWDTFILIDPSSYFLKAVDCQAPYLSLLHRVFACLSKRRLSCEGLPPKMVLFDSSLKNPNDYNLPEALPSLRLVEKLFDLSVSITQDSLAMIVPSSQGEELDQEEDSIKELRFSTI
ncbi:hypothetical protein CPB83DRAFT_336657 [Crepidotus variabilis]|uniref:Uncharacterized protein n=1 Tax=Crepidotus variabilis TaxID=179855 RepID=A0A9P6ETL7_9AGAR|nr:hypothetical protein CPB83DRAFT_336657 [Crepidotus variabilis]